jgi:hypothetical protein
LTAYRDTFHALPRVQDMQAGAKRAAGVALVGFLYYRTDGSAVVIMGAIYAWKQGLL